MTYTRDEIKAAANSWADRNHNEATKAATMIRQLLVENDGLRSAAEALGALPDGYCFCSKDRSGTDAKEHEPECAELRVALK